MRLFGPFPAARLFYPGAVFRFGTKWKEACLTFDDGPNPLSTPVILEVLEKHHIRAIFFCTGMNAEKYPDLIMRIIAGGHIVGNHGYSHLNGFKHPSSRYIKDVRRATKCTSLLFFRPPYGRLRPAQYHILKRSFRIVFWDIMTYDFDRKLDPDIIFNLLMRKIRPGSIIVFHDKPESSVMTLLEDFLLSAAGKGYRFVLPGFVTQETATLLP
jgi:peptidoglycan/xylan/chitin deacetylase (PgdA/CDA1 family)